MDRGIRGHRGWVTAGAELSASPRLEFQPFSLLDALPAHHPPTHEQPHPVWPARPAAAQNTWTSLLSLPNRPPLSCRDVSGHPGRRPADGHPGLCFWEDWAKLGPEAQARLGQAVWSSAGHWASAATAEAGKQRRASAQPHREVSGNASAQTLKPCTGKERMSWGNKTPNDNWSYCAWN